MREQKNEGFPSVGDEGMERQIAPFFPPFPRLGQRTWPPPPRRRDRFKRARDCSPGDLQEGVGRQPASALQERTV